MTSSPARSDRLVHEVVKVSTGSWSAVTGATKLPRSADRTSSEIGTPQRSVAAFTYTRHSASCAITYNVYGPGSTPTVPIRARKGT